MKILTQHPKGHPDYNTMTTKWVLYRDILNGGDEFVERYLKQYSVREDATDFNNRREMTYCPAHAEAALMDIRNSIYQRMVDIVRESTVESYANCINGNFRGVDNKSATMNSFIGRVILTELLFLGKVGIFVDRSPTYLEARTREGRMAKHPYLVKYNAEDIINWSYDDEENLKGLFLRSTKEIVDDDGLVTGTEESFRKLIKRDDHVEVIEYDAKEVETSRVTLDLPQIPFVILTTSRSLLTNIARYQIALLNMESSDVSYAIRSNFTFYTEQYDPRMELFTRGGENQPEGDGTAADAGEAISPTIRTGHIVGRRYPMGAERPEFISPPSEPLQVSMEKEKQIQEDLRKLINLNLSMLEPTRASADSKKMDARGLESGLAYIGMELEHAERQVAEIWANYERMDASGKIVIKYPSSYDIKTDTERHTEADDFFKKSEQVASPTFKREMIKEGVKILLHARVPNATLTAVIKEIDDNSPVVGGTDTVIKLHEEGLISTATSCSVLGLDPKEAEKAEADHVRRAAAIVQAQNSAKENAASRGAPDLDENINSGAAEKEGKAGRGEAK